MLWQAWLSGVVLSTVAQPCTPSSTKPCEADPALQLDNVTWLSNDSLRSDLSNVTDCLCEMRPCLRKCCPEGSAYASNGTCVATDDPLLHPFNPSIYHSKADLKPANLLLGHFYRLYGAPDCKNGRFRLDPINEPKDEFYVLRDGSIYGPNIAPERPGHFCLEVMIDVQTTVLLLCFPDQGGEGMSATDTVFTVYPVGMIISIPFLLMTFLVYALIPELRNLHGKSLMCHVSSLLSSYVFLTVVQVGGDTVPITICIFCAFVIQFTFLATFFWLNIMCFDIWWAFSDLKPLTATSVKDREHKKFIFYSVYAWGCPSVILVITMAMELLPGIPDSKYKPKFGFNKCWFHSNVSLWIYFYMWILVLLVINIVMFISTAIRLIEHSKQTSVLKSKESRRHDENERQRFNLYLKLFIVMGINWAMEIISFVVGGAGWWWYVTDLANTLQGVLIFLIFVWKRRILRLLNARICPSYNFFPTNSRSQSGRINSMRTSSALSRRSSSNGIKTVPSTDESDYAVSRY